MIFVFAVLDCSGVQLKQEQGHISVILFFDKFCYNENFRQFRSPAAGGSMHLAALHYEEVGEHEVTVVCDLHVASFRSSTWPRTNACLTQKVKSLLSVFTFLNLGGWPHSDVTLTMPRCVNTLCIVSLYGMQSEHILSTLGFGKKIQIELLCSACDTTVENHGGGNV